MPRHPILVPVWLAAALSLSNPRSLPAQGQELEVSYGRWWHGSPTDVFSASLYRPLVGPFDYGLGVTHLADRSTVNDRTLTGGDLALTLGRGGSGPYLLASVGFGVRHADRNVDANWTAGGGYVLRASSFLALALEARYRVEDREVRGFWRLDPADREGLQVQARLAIGLGGTGGRRPSGNPRPGGGTVYEPPSEHQLATAARLGGVSEDAAALAADVVRTALDVMGTPYEWGGTDENGFDCSGLIQYAYGEHGLLLPRVSRDQARMGMLVERRIDSLNPGDILAFSVNGNGVSHVGLYVGDGRFIHSSSSGVKLSDLRGGDPDGRWWRQRWVAVRRVLN